MKALVTGAGGFVGPFMVRELLLAGYSVAATCTQKPLYLDNPKFKDVRFISADLRDHDALSRAIQGVDRIYHIGAVFDFYKSMAELFSVNVVGTRNLCELSLEHGVREIIYFSSGAIYGIEYGNREVVEADQPYPKDKYARSKWEAEQTVFRYNGRGDLRILTMRPGAIYGAGSSYGDASALKLLKKGLLFAIPGFSDMASSHTHVKDAVGAALYLSEKQDLYNTDAIEPHEVAYNVCENTPVFSSVLLKTASKLIDKKGLLGFWPIRIPVFPLRIAAYFAELFAKLTNGSPPFELDSIDYIAAGHALSNAKLMATGYDLRYPDVLKALPETIEWYEKTDWEVFKNPAEVRAKMPQLGGNGI